MAALIKHGAHIRSCFILSCGSMSLMVRNRKIMIFMQTRKFINSQTNDLPVPTRLRDTEASLSSKGFLRSQRPYVPPEDVRSKVLSVIKLTLGSEHDINKKIDSLSDKFQVLAECHKEFNHCVPNSLLHALETLGDIIKFYETPVVTTTPLDQMKTMDLPPNLHIQHDYHRFHPDHDVMFGGISAFPKSSTIVTGLRYKKKYPGYNAKKSWP